MKKYLLILLRVIPAFILLQTLFFKFTGAEQSVELFRQLGVEPWGRYLSGILELIAGVFLLIPTKTVKGAYLAIIIMIGALGAHIFKLGFDGMNGQLGVMAVVVLLTSIGVVVTHKK